MLAKKPEMLTGRDAEVTVLFCDLRGFSSISEIHGAKRSIELINEVLTELSHCVVNKDGVLVDYVGDELLAMWGAPQAQPDHPQRAMDCAQTMLTAARLLSNRWSEAFGIKIDVGIGVNSGSAQVGNVGSQLKFKYGVLGHTVNLASRIQSASKQFGVRCLLPEQTVRYLNNRDCLRRIGRIRVAGIGQEVEVYECVEQPTKEWTYLKEQYEHALDDYLSFEPSKSIERLTKLAHTYDDDQATRYLLRRAEQMQSTPRDEQAVVWELTSK
jgi:adenylate cyclase